MGMSDMMEKSMAEQPTYPPEQSCSGSNAYTFHCPSLGFRPGYAVCLHKIKAYERDGSLISNTDCESAIAGRSCSALHMRQEEQEAGKAIYFWEYDRMRGEMRKRGDEFMPEVYRRRAEHPQRRTAIERATQPVTPPKQPTIAPPSNGFADAINAAMRETTETPKPAPAPAPVQETKIEAAPSLPPVETPVAPTPAPAKFAMPDTTGMSLIEIARLRMRAAA